MFPLFAWSKYVQYIPHPLQAVQQTQQASCKECKINLFSANTVSHGQPMRDFICVGLHQLLIAKQDGKSLY